MRTMIPETGESRGYEFQIPWFKIVSRPLQEPQEVQDYSVSKHARYIACQKEAELHKILREKAKAEQISAHNLRRRRKPHPLK